MLAPRLADPAWDDQFNLAWPGALVNPQVVRFPAARELHQLGGRAAAAEAHLTGQHAVHAGSCGPGHLPLINAVATRQGPKVNT